MPMAFNNIYRLSIQTRIGTITCVNVMHFVQDGPYVNGAEVLGTTFYNKTSATWRAAMSTGVLFERIDVINMVPFHTEGYAYVYAAGVYGTIAGSVAAPVLAQVITIHTGFPGRRKRGRLFISGAPGGNDAGGNWSTAMMTARQNLATKLHDEFIGAGGVALNGFMLGVWSRLNGGALPPYTTDGFTRATSLQVRQPIRVQRRREIGVGI